MRTCRARAHRGQAGLCEKGAQETGWHPAGGPRRAGKSWGDASRWAGRWPAGQVTSEGEGSRRAGGGDRRHGLAHALSCKNRIFAGGAIGPGTAAAGSWAALTFINSTLTLE
ncbi:hypothetical protein GCM10010269_34560 [Streptomyces humidus]|uniref:Uncharacterized protein n=1 Tax=Streptomyces humidus TaxID=52259 RepID=A0A918FW00_9ACTN|nr:hypothetical protein GCM10010269_34560 [Streptomyces humidus]